jgi:site-specific DNA-methyltransferase (adenine-specific)|tara:strand:- start:3982 stop:4755 length:774 start_codon:yes stop_codon:yes gene_type:complete
MNNIDLKQQDAYEFLQETPSDSVDLVLTDPPYEISKPSGFIDSLTKPDGTPQSERTLRRFGISLDFGEWDKNELNLLPYIQEMYRVLKPSGTMIMFYDIWKITPLKNMMEASKFKQLRYLEWIKTNPVPINSKINYLTNSREIALTGVKKSKPVFNSEYDNGVYRYPIYHAKDRFHPTQKSLKLFEDLIKKHSNQDDTVLDCFLGSGTTAVAALRTKRNFIGCEIDESYYIKMKERVEKYEDEQNKEQDSICRAARA